jgi:ubiquinol-cytochrome c reductase cytochrome c subunit
MELAAAALALYATYCSSCHGARGEGSSIAPPLVGKSATDISFMLDTGRMPAAAPGVNEIHRQPIFTRGQIAQLVEYVASLSSPGARTSLPRVLSGNAAAGGKLFTENCAQCHGAAGEGDSVGSNNVAPSLAGTTREQIGEAIRTGPGVMPRFGRDVLSDRDVDDIASYVNYMQTQGNAPNGPNSGGFSLAHVGPVAEGFVAWLFGLGALVLFIRRIGSTD